MVQILLPVDIGSYAVSAKVEEANYDGDTSDILIITDLTAPVPDLPVLPDVTGECSAHSCCSDRNRFLCRGHYRYHRHSFPDYCARDNI